MMQHSQQEKMSEVNQLQIPINFKLIYKRILTLAS